MTEDEIIAVVTAYKEGKTVQYRDKGRKTWGICNNPWWDFSQVDYRIKPEPRDFWIHKRSTEMALANLRSKPDGVHMKDYIHVREVLDEEG